MSGPTGSWAITPKSMTRRADPGRRRADSGRRRVSRRRQVLLVEHALVEPRREADVAHIARLEVHAAADLAAGDGALLASEALQEMRRLDGQRAASAGQVEVGADVPAQVRQPEGAAPGGGLGRPRPPSSGRPPDAGRIRTPDPYRVRQYRGLDARRKATPAPARFSLAVAILALAVVAFVAASGSVGPLAAAFGTGFSGVVNILTASSAPPATQVVPTTSPIIPSPAKSYTNQATTELKVTLPPRVPRTRH